MILSNEFSGTTSRLFNEIFITKWQMKIETGKFHNVMIFAASLISVINQLLDTTAYTTTAPKPTL